ncbi:importin beta-like SAD2-like protein isoform X1 [Iris pallida]|uniref:Importin beta-like SAD2-like protein isoform X1 n=1 Tax=Iris pallida TaxID=29817 RepID=A0AAX6E427_IRIPA|nr:importin beta-like SAD2-like protein isoform X1 [Iris pallida]
MRKILITRPVWFEIGCFHYMHHSYSPYLVATANWVLGSLAPCLPQAMAGDVYRCLMKSLAMPDIADCNCYPVRASAAGAIAELLENNHVPPDWLSLLQILADRIGGGDENESSLLFQLLGTVIEAGQEKVVTHIPVIVFHITGVIAKNLPPTTEPWPQVVEHGFSALAVIAQIWEQSMPDDIQLPENKEWRSGWASIARVFSSLLQQAWVMPLEPMEDVVSSSLPPPSCVDDASQLLGFVMRFVTSMDEAVELKLTQLLVVWADLIADWDAWEEMEDLAVFSSIQAAINLHRRCNFTNYFMSTSQKLSGGLARSIIEGISAFVCKGIGAYPSATRRACSCVHALLHVPSFSFETEAIRQSMAVEFARASFCHFRDTDNKSRGLWKPLLLAISSCYIIYPDNVKQLLGKVEDEGFTVWASALASISTRSFEFGLSSESEIKLAVITLAKVVEHLLSFPSDRGNEILHDCFRSLMEACIHLKEVQEDGEGSDEQIDDNDDDEEEDSDGNDDDEDSEDDEREETEQEFLDRYAKAAATLGEEMVEDGDSEDEAQELELGGFDEVDIQTNIVSLLDRFRGVLISGQVFPPNLVQGIIDTCPEYSSFFHVN